MSIEALREFIGRHGPSAAALAALGATLDARATGVPLDPALAARIGDLLAAMGAGDVLDGVSAQEAAPMVAALRFMMRLDAKLLFASSRSMVWNHVEPEILQAGGDLSVIHAQMLSRMVVPALDGLSQRLAAPGAAFLDIGVGAAGLSIAMTRLFPELRVVGVDPWQPSLALARDNVAEAGLDGRIELREQAAEALTDEQAFDLVWFPAVFIPERVIAAGCERARHALRPGGWMVYNMAAPGPDATSAALARLRTTFWGGWAASAAEVEGVLRDSGLVDVRTLPVPPGALAVSVVGRRAPA